MSQTHQSPGYRPKYDDEEQDLLRQIAAHDHQAFEKLYQRYKPRLTAYLQSLTNTHEMVEDLLHDVLLVVWQQAARYQATSRVSTWLFGIARHKALKAMARATKSMSTPPHVPNQLTALDPEYEMTRRESARRICCAFDRLPSPQREVLTLTYDHGHTAQTIARIQQCSTATVHKSCSSIA